MPRVALDIARRRAGPLIARRQPRRVDLPFDGWGLSLEHGRLARRGIPFEQMVAEFGSPLHVVDAVALRAKAAAAVGAPGTRVADVFSSYKTNPVPGVLRVLHDGGIGAEVISPFELWLAMRLGVPGQRLIYNGPAKSDASLVDAIRHGALAINANTAEELGRLGTAATIAGRRANVGLRVSLPGMWSGQFGIPSTSAHVHDAVAAAGADDRVELRAVHVHRGGTLRTAAEFEAHVRQVLDFCLELRAGTGWTPAIVDFGGSLATPTVASIPEREYRLNRALATDLLPPDPADCIGVAAAAVLAQEMVDAAFAGGALPRAVLEPGRGLTGDTQLLLTTVVAVHDDGPIPHAVLDAGINVAEPTHGEYHQVFSATAPGAPVGRSYRLVGPICTPADVLYHHWRLPDLAPGHVLAVMDSGAYFVPFSTSFSFPRPAIVLQGEHDTTLLRAAESFDDIVRLDRI